ncbi:unnamed protein product [Peronospora farinosa]|uniref:non-specific serine/threonine protein kinase n=2 Tax=Peronospora farinosa TaxID=134698 RepID=A0AAV0TCI0_9STRA|nr:unnamed protein product [Peronospora farinosa]
MSSGFGFKGREGRCYQFWKGVEQCSKDTEYSGQCGKQVEDYIECLHHRKEELRCIGRGSYGSAYLVQDRTCLENRFVVKKIPMELLSAKEKDQSFHEVELLAKLKHPNVVEYKENFVADNVLHIIMAYCDGGDLADKIKEQHKIREQIVGPDNNSSDPRGYFPISQVLDWFVQMAMAIKYLHDQRVLHRDLKTSNVFLTTENVVKLGDFGIAKTLDSTLDQAKTVVGTPYYMSPEVCESKPYSYASDVWSLGCVLYEMLALRHAFDASNILMLILKIVQQDCNPVPPCYGKEVSDLLHRLLDKDPERRPSMEEIFAMPYIRHHMQGLVASGGSLKVKVINPLARRPQYGSASARGRRRLHSKNLSARRSSGEKKQLRSAQTAFSQVAPMQWIPIQPFTADTDHLDTCNEPERLDSSILQQSQLSFRLPERNTTLEPQITTEEKPHPVAIEKHGLMPDEEVDEDSLNSMPTAVWPQPRLASRERKLFAWGQGESSKKPHANGSARSSSNEADDDDSQFQEKELMNPNFQSEYSDECIDSFQNYYSSKDTKENCSPSKRELRQPEILRQRGMGNLRTPFHQPLSCVSNDVNAEDTRVPKFSEISMMRELELDGDSDDDDRSTDTSLGEYEAEENFYSDDSSDFHDHSGTQYSDDFEDADAEVIEYADGEFNSEGEGHEKEHHIFTTREEGEGVASHWDDFVSTTAGYRPTGDDDNCHFARIEGPAEAQWVIRKVAQSLMLTTDDLHPQQAA